mmetsp:Transcript_3514/g.5282  ORF Transcript_3514/g.5282 Transcript_3514/m.5282 type:complete len:176 (-) Transcript_3514:1717-2244(-)
MNVCNFQAFRTIVKSAHSWNLPYSLSLMSTIKERAGKGVKPGAAIVIDNFPHRVTKITQGKRGKGGGFVRAMLKNLTNGSCFEKTFTSDEIVEFADLEKVKYKYIYRSSDNFTFMHHETFEEMQVQKDIIEHWDFLVDSEDMEVKLLSFNGRVIGVELPNTYDYEVVKVNTDKSR